ncbi:MAG: hypothetical protein DCC65_08450 [Planctomycetota bacterium]|nr:MAG: hypothetical protein DCC65_08450 [Planctomycetota bacterium]
MKALPHLVIAIVVCACQCGHAIAQLEIDWHTIDGGGGVSSGGGLTLVGTIGQHDAGSPDAPLTGGGFTVVGGFWQMAAPSCACPGDMNADDAINGMDIQLFVHCMLGAGSNCPCANVDQTGGLDLPDIDAFVNDVLAVTPCP